MAKIQRSHLYDLGSYQFREIDDVSLLIYEVTALERFEEWNNLRKSTNSTDFKLRHSSIVPQFQTTTPQVIEIVRRHGNPSETTVGFMDGLKTTIGKVNEKINLLSGTSSFKIGFRGFKVTEYAKVLTLHKSCSLFFPVDVQKCVKVGEEEFEICINFDNPTSLDVRNQPNGCQGSHFGYTIITKSNGNRTRGHVLITTFIGYPSRNAREKVKIMEAFKDRNENSKAMSFEMLCNSAMNSRKSLPFNITTDKGVHSSLEYISMYQSDRTKKLPIQLKAIHVTFNEQIFELPDFKNKRLERFWN